MQRWPRKAGGFAMPKSRGKSWICLCQTANPVALNGMNHRANAQVTAAVLITNGRCLILFLKSHSFTPSGTHRHTTKLYFAQAVKLTQSTVRTIHGDCFKTHFQFTVEVFCNGRLLNVQYHLLLRH